MSEKMLLLLGLRFRDYHALSLGSIGHAVYNESHHIGAAHATGDNADDTECGSVPH